MEQTENTGTEEKDKVFEESLVKSFEEQGLAVAVSEDTLKSLDGSTEIGFEVIGDNQLSVIENGAEIALLDMDKDSFPEDLMETVSTGLDI